jgi:hypothetical protein
MGKYFSLDIEFENHIFIQNFPQFLQNNLVEIFLWLENDFLENSFPIKNYLKTCFG